MVVFTEIELQRSRDAAEAGNLAAAGDRARTARTIQPWSGEPYMQLALLYGQNGDVPAGLRYLRQAEDRDHDDWRLALIESAFYSRSGNTEASTQAFNRANRWSPFSSDALIDAFSRLEGAGR